MKVKIIRATIAQKRQVLPGEELEVSQNEGVLLIGAGKAVAVKEDPETTDKPTGDVETSGSPASNTADKPNPAPRRRTASSTKKASE